MGGLAQASGQQHLFLLSGGVVAHILLELHSLEAQLPQDRQEQALIETVPGGVVPQQAPQTGGVLRHVGDDQPAGCLQGAGIGDILPAQQLENTGLAAAVCPAQRHAVALRHGEGYAAAHDPAAVVDGHLPQHCQPLGVMGQRMQLQSIAAFDVLQQRGLLLDGVLLPPFQIFPPLLHPPGLLGNEGASAHGVGGALDLGGVFPDLRPLHPVGPVAGLPRRLLQPPDLLFEPLILRQLKGVLPPLVLVPRGKIPLLHLDAAAVDGQDVIYAAVQKGAVVGHQQEALFAAEIAAHQRPPQLIQMVGGLVDEEKAVFPGKEHGQQELGLLAAGQRGKGTVQCVLRHLQRRQLPQEPPRSHVGADALQQLHGTQRWVLHGVGKIVEAHAGVYCALIGIPSL